MGDGNMKLIENIRRKYQLDDLKFEVSQRKKCGPIKKAQGTLDGWVSGGPGKAPKPQKDAKAPKPKKQTPEEIAAEMKRMKEQNERFKEEMRLRAEEAKKKKTEGKKKKKKKKKKS